MQGNQPLTYRNLRFSAMFQCYSKQIMLTRYEFGEVPPHYPGDEFTRPNTQNGVTSKFYELYRVEYVRTTSGQIIVLPRIEHRAFAEASDIGASYDCDESFIPQAHLSDTQSQAIEIAKRLKSRRDQELPVNTFPFLRKLAVDSDGLLQICESREDVGIDLNEPALPVSSATALADIDVATAVYGYHVHRYAQADLNEFIPEELVGRANAYIFTITGEGNEWLAVDRGDYRTPEYRVGRIRLFEAVADIHFEA